MSKYTTGEVAKMCDVTIRTVQYYDSCQILIPSELTDGGRRLYTDEDVSKLKIICFLRDLGFKINSIKEILNDEDNASIILLLIEQQEQQIKEEYNKAKANLDTIRELKSHLKAVSDLSVNSIGDVAHIMKMKNKLRKVRIAMISWAIPVEVLEIASIIFWIKSGIWWPFVISLAITILFAIFVSKYYYKKVAYICSKCHKVFKPKFKEMFWANHTPNTRKLTCPMCNEKKWCVETYDESSDKE